MCECVFVIWAVYCVYSRIFRCYRCFAFDGIVHVCESHTYAYMCARFKFVSTRNMVLTFAHIQPFKSAQYVILILTSHSRIIFHLFSAFWMDFMPGCFYERAYVFVFHFDGRTNQFQAFDF